MKKSFFLSTIRAVGMTARASMQLSYGMYHLSHLRGPMVTILGSALIRNDHGYSKDAMNVAHKFVSNGFSVLTGGGPGIMESANCGAIKAKKELHIKEKCTLGISIPRIDIDYTNPCSSIIYTDFFFVRKFLLLYATSGVIVFPGGIGTVDELFDILNLHVFGHVQTIPIVLFDRLYWQKLADWYYEAIQKGTIRPKFKKLFTITDSIDEVYSLICANRATPSS